MYTFLTFGISRDPRHKRGNIIYRAPKRVPNAIEVVGIDLAELGMQAAVIDRPDLIEANVFILRAQADMHVPRSLTQLSRRGGDEVKTVGQLSEYKDRTREAIASSPSRSQIAAAVLVAMPRSFRRRSSRREWPDRRWDIVKQRQERFGRGLNKLLILHLPLRQL